MGIIVAFITGVLGPVTLIYLKHVLSKKKVKCSARAQNTVD